jgi:iron complex transport system ATP-binding protein
MGCGHLDGQRLGDCSQGERQRVLLARALFGRPELLLLDEPAAGLDLPGREALVAALEETGDLGDVPTILVTHHLEELPSTTTHVALLRDGTPTAAGSIEDVLTDAAVGACFGLPLSVRRAGGRWTAVRDASAEDLRLDRPARPRGDRVDDPREVRVQGHRRRG